MSVFLPLSCRSHLNIYNSRGRAFLEHLRTSRIKAHPLVLFYQTGEGMFFIINILSSVFKAISKITFKFHHLQLFIFWVSSPSDMLLLSEKLV